ncbi:MAG: APC family permease [bacterium]|jgi:amino acid transporter|nr:APC family permease [Caldisericota bacterium]
MADKKEVVPAGGVEEFGYKQELKRVLSFWDLLVYGLVFMVPIAPMGIYGVVAQASKGMVPLTYIIGAVAMVFTALSYWRMAQAYPIAGSVYSYVQRGISPHVGFIAGWTILLDYILVPALVYLVSGLWLSAEFPAIPFWVWIIAFIVLNTILNVLGIDIMAKAMWIMLGIELLAFLAFVIAAIIAIANGAATFTFKPFFDPENFSWSFVLTATSISVLSYLGFDAISTLAEETRDPKRMIGRSMVAALGLLAFFFVIQTWLAGCIWPDYNSFPNPDVAFFHIAEKAGGAVVRVLCLIGTVLAWGVGDGLASQAAVSRILYGMARDEQLPPFLAKVSAKYKTPWVATIVVAVITLPIAVLLPLDKLSSLVNFGALTAFLFLHVTVVSNYIIKGKQFSFRDIFNYLLLPLIGFVIIGFVWVSLDALAKTLGFIWLGVGLVLLVIVTRGFKKVPPALQV